MAYNGSGTFVVNSAGQPVVANTVISATVFNALTADLATGLSTCITKDGQTTVTANIPFGNNKITALGAGTAASDAANLGQVQSTAAKLITVTGTDTITGTMSPQLTAYAAGQLFYFVANAANTGAVTINIDGLGAKSITRDGSTALAAGDINSGEFVVVIYDGTRFQMINAANSFGNTTINGTLTVTGNTALQANVSITSTLSVGGTFAVTGAATLGSTLAVTGKSDLPTVSTASINAAVALITTGTVTNLTATGASIASANIGNLQFTAASIASINAGVAVITNLTATSASIASANVATAVITTGTVTNLTSTSASIASMNAGVALVTTATITGLTATGASVASANVGTAVVTGLTVTGASIASVNAGVAVLSGNLTLNGGTANGVLYLNASKVATSGSALTFDGTGKLGVGTTTPVAGVSSGLEAVGEIWATTAASNANQIRLSPSTSGANIIYSTYSGSGSYLPLAFNVSGSEQMRLTSTGLGIGTTSPANALEIARGAGVAGGASFRGNGNSAAAEFFVGQGGGSDAFLYNRANATMIFGTNNTTRMTLDASGNLGIGTTSPASRLDVRNTGGTYDKGISVQTSAAGNIGTFWTSATDLNIGIAGAHKFTNFDGSATRMTLDSSGNLGIGTTSPTAKLDVAGTGAAGFQTIARVRTASGNSEGLLIRGNYTTEEYLISNFYPFSLAFGTNNTERARITAAGELLVGTTTTTANGGVIQVSNGITFPATQSASSNANTLDDYEEGTWTPTYVPATGAFGAVTYDPATLGRYTKVGNTVFCSGALRTDAITVGTASGGVSIGGLPFTANATGPNSTVSVGYVDAFGGDAPFGGSVTFSATTAFIWYRTTSNGGSTQLDVTDLGTGTNANYMVFSIIYTV